MLPAHSIVLTWLSTREVALRKGAGNGHINSQPLPTAPEREGDIAGAATRGITKNALLLQNGGEGPLDGQTGHEIPKTIVTNRGVPRHPTVGGMIAEIIHGLHAKGAEGTPQGNGHPKTKARSDQEGPLRHNRVEPID